MPERRGSPRQNVQLAARLAYGGISVDCTVRNISETGAAVQVLDAKNVPNMASLVISGKPGRQQVEVVWRTSDMIGLRFV